jgi:hypothetical protein
MGLYQLSDEGLTTVDRTTFAREKGLPPLFLTSPLRGSSVLRGCFYANEIPKRVPGRRRRVARSGRFT